MSYSPMVYNTLGQRQASISMVRFIAMIMIIVCHMFQYYDHELCHWFNVGVQVFFVISGFLYGLKEIDNPIRFLSRSFIKILVPYYVFLCIAICLYSLFCPSEFGGLNVVIEAIVCAGTLPGLGHLWFVGYILFCYLITPYLHWLKKFLQGESSPAKVLVVYTLVLLVIQVLGFSFRSYFLPDRVSAYVIGFFASDLIARFGDRMKRFLSSVFLILTMVLNGAEIFTKYFWKPSFSGFRRTLFNGLYQYAHLFLGVALFFFLNECFRSIRYTGFLKASDKYSYSIYLVHVLFILSPFTLMSISSFRVLNWGVVVLAVLGAGVLLQSISSRFIAKFPVQG